MKNSVYLLSLTALLGGTSAHAVLKPSDILSTAVVNHAVEGRRAEICAIPQHFTDGDYRKKDAEQETKLCSYEANTNAAVCPKEYSTNPAALFFTPPEGKSVADLQAQDCEMEGAKKQAKYKLSTSCSYTPSLLSYYQVSRMLGNIVNVPVAVVRTMDLQRHQAIAEKALLDLESKKGELIYRTWKGLKTQLEEGLRGKSGDLLFVEGGDQSYGALQKNPRGEEFYREFFNNGTDRAQEFKEKNRIYKASTTLALNVGREWNQENVQAMQQLKDVSDMLVIDTILGQKDRFGNIHYEEKFFYPTQKDGKFKIKDEDKQEEVPAELRGRAVAIKELMLKDNDCGVAKENQIKAAKLLDPVAHMDPKTYKRVLKMEKAGDNNKELFLRAMLFTEEDYRKVMANLQETAKMLRDSCKAGKLKLDLDLDKHFSGEALPTTYECEPQI